MSLAANAFLYEACRGAAQRAVSANDPGAAAAIELAATAAWKLHPGRFADGALENLLLELGRGVSEPGDEEASPDNGANLTLHVASEVYETGGHSRVLTKWMQLDTTSTHALVLTRQSIPVPRILREVWDSMSIPVTLMDASSPAMERARQLKSLSRGSDRVVLHHHPDDSVPVLAYASDKRAPVILFNHAHFNFGLGTSVAELVVNTLPYYGMVSQTRRAARNVDLLVGRGGLDPLDTASIDKKSAKVDLSLPLHGPVALAIGNQQYFTPAGNDNFFHLALALLAKRPDLTFIFVGVATDFRCIPDELRRHERVRFFGNVPDPRAYYRAADICIESFPVPSLGAVAESVFYGEAYPVLSYCESENILRPAIPGWPARVSNADEHFGEIVRLLDDIDATRRAARELRLRAAEEDRHPVKQFERLYALAESVPLASQPIPEMPAQSDPDDLMLAQAGGNRIAEYIDLIPSRSLRARCFAGAWLRGYLGLGSLYRGVRRIVVR